MRSRPSLLIPALACVVALASPSLATDLDKITQLQRLSVMSKAPLVAVQVPGTSSAKAIPFWRAVEDVIQAANGTVSTFQPACSDLTAICALDTEPFGRELLECADAASCRTYLGVGAGTGDVVGPASSTNSDIACFDGATGKLLKDCGTNVPTATALLANGANCSAGSAPLGVDASGAVESCTAYQAADADLAAIAALGTSASRIPYRTGPGTWAETPLPSGSLMGTSATQSSITNKDFQDSSTTISDNTDATKKVAFEVSGVTTGTTRTVTARNSNGTMAYTEDIGSTVQGYDADLNSWAGVTRATGLDTFAATPTSANLATLLADETGSGPLVFATNPTLVNETVEQSTSSTYQRHLFQKTNDDIEVRSTLSTVTTTDGTATVISSLTPGFPADGLGGIATCRYIITAISTDTDSQDSVLAAEGFATFKRLGQGTFENWWTNRAIHGNSATSTNAAGTPLTWTVTQGTSGFGSVLEVRVTGGAATTILWHGRFEWMWHHI